MTENTASKKKTFEERAASKPTELHEAFAKWIEMETGYKPDLKTVQLAVSLRMDFQKSAENQASLAERKAEAKKKAEEAKAKKLAKLQAELAKLKGEEAAPVETEEKPEEPAEAPKDESEAPAEEAVENAPEEAAEPVEEAAPVAKPRVRRTRRTTTQK